METTRRVVRPDMDRTLLPDAASIVAPWVEVSGSENADHLLWKIRRLDLDGVVYRVRRAINPDWQDYAMIEASLALAHAMIEAGASPEQREKWAKQDVRAEAIRRDDPYWPPGAFTPRDCEESYGTEKAAEYRSRFPKD
jgi:hypothetical protein